MMKKPLFFLLAIFSVQMAFSQAVSLKVTAYDVDRRPTANQYEKAELSINDETQSWEIVLYRKDQGAPERIVLEDFKEVSGNGVFHKVSISEKGQKSGAGLFGYIPVFKGEIQIQLCNTHNERIRRKLVLGI